MGDFKMGSKTVMSQSGTSNPTFGTGAPTGAVVIVVESTFIIAQVGAFAPQVGLLVPDWDIKVFDPILTSPIYIS